METKEQLDSFSLIHALAYSFIGFQTIYIATRWNPIFWNTACLIVNSGSLEETTIPGIEIKEKTTDYSKNAKALGDIISRGIKVSLVDINKSNYSFEPDIENNEILFGMKALTGINKEQINTIIKNRPYKNIADFMQKCPLNKTSMISLIKAGAFDKLFLNWSRKSGIHSRLLNMGYYLSKVCEPKKKLTLQNFNGLIQHNLIPQELDFEKRTFIFNKYLKNNMKRSQYYIFDEPSLIFYTEFFDKEFLNVINGFVCILQSDWDNLYKIVMDNARIYLRNHQEDLLKEYNKLLFLEQWEKYAMGNISSWEMESLCFYYNRHELADVDLNKYGIDNFNSLPEEPEIDYYFKRNNKSIPIYKLNRIIGTVIGKDDPHSSVAILTTEGVVSVKFTKDYFAMFNKQISEVQADGSKKVMEKSWFKRGTKIMCTGFRRGDMFQAKSYKNTPTHQLYKITSVNEDGTIDLTHQRYGQAEV